MFLFVCLVGLLDGRLSNCGVKLGAIEDAGPLATVAVSVADPALAARQTEIALALVSEVRELEAAILVIINSRWCDWCDWYRCCDLGDARWLRRTRHLDLRLRLCLRRGC